MSTWLDVVGIGEDGVEGLSPNAVNVLKDAEIIIGGERHHKLSGDFKAQRLSWPSPFDSLVEEIISFK